MAQKFTVPITVKQLASAGSDAVTVYVDQDTFSRLKVEAGGRLTWGSGASAGDVNLYRDGVDVLKTDDTFKTPTLFVDNIEIDPTGAVTNDVLVYNGSKFTAASVALGGGGASLTVSDTAPASPEEGDLWFNSSNAKTYVYYDSSWVEVGGSGGVATLDEIGNVTAPSPANGDYLQWNGSAWVNDAINLGTDTVGNYVSSVTAGTGISVNFTPGEGVGASVSLNATLDQLSDVVAPSPAYTNPLIWNGTEWASGSQELTLGVPGTTDFLSISATSGLSNSTAAGENFTISHDSVTGTDGTGGPYFNLNANNVTFSNGTDSFIIDPYWGTSGQVLAFSPGGGSGGTWGPTTPTLDFLSDVSAASPSAGNVLTYNGSAWTAASAGGGGGASVTVSETPPASPSSGDLWFESDTTRTYVYYDSFWIEVGGLAPTAIVSDTAPVSPVTGQVWFNSLNGGTYIYYSSAWTEVGAVPVNNLLNLLDAKGDMFVGSADNTAAKLSVGTTGQVLMVDPAATYGVKWAVIPPSGGLSTSTEGAIMTMAIGA